jgi:hypothetical protein
MSSLKQTPLRKLAEVVLDQHFGELEPQLKQDLAISLVRQWTTNDGHAGLVTLSHHHWFRMVRTQGGGFEVGYQASPPQFMEDLRRWNVSEEEIPDLLHNLNCQQSVLCNTAEGERIKLRLVAQERTLLIEPVEAEED